MDWTWTVSTENGQKYTLNIDAYHILCQILVLYALMFDKYFGTLTVITVHTYHLRIAVLELNTKLQVSSSSRLKHMRSSPKCV